MLKVLPVLLVLLTTACTEQEPVTWHQAHKYKGKQDTLKTDPQALATRFKQVQRDR